MRAVRVNQNKAAGSETQTMMRDAEKAPQNRVIILCRLSLWATPFDAVASSTLNMNILIIAAVIVFPMELI